MKHVMILSVLLLLIGCQTKEERKREEAKARFEAIHKKQLEAKRQREEAKKREELKRQEEEKLELAKKEEDKRNEILRVEDLYAEYNANEVRCRKNYNKKRFKVRGIIESISEIPDYKDVELAFEYKGFIFGGIGAEFDEEQLLHGKSLLDYNKGDEVLVDGIIYMDAGGIRILCQKRFEGKEEN